MTHFIIIYYHQHNKLKVINEYEKFTKERLVSPDNSNDYKNGIKHEKLKQ